MPEPVIAIIGRPNVGKSTLFNRMTRTHKAIVEDIPGVTRDRIYQKATYDERGFIVIDTGGLFPETNDEILIQIRQQAMFAVEEADLIVLLFDGKEGLTELDRQIVDMLRPVRKNLLYVVNKIDAYNREDRLFDFYSLGVDELIPVSAATGYGFAEFMEKVLETLPEKEVAEKAVEGLPGIAIVGKPNVGKSTFVNSLLGKERMIVSPEPGTTRDSVDSICKYYGKEYIIIDTAGLRRKSRIVDYSLEKFMIVRVVRSIERADVVLLLIDASEGISEQDQKIAALISRYGKGLVLLFNKWDLIEDLEKRYKELLSEVHWKLRFVEYAPVLTISGLSRKRITKVFSIVDEIISERKKRISTSALNKFVSEIAPLLPTHKGKKTKIFYMTQTDIEPPTFVLFVNYPQVFKPEHTRFIERLIRQKYTFKGTPIRVFIRQRSK
ncbi:MAG TPA: ribosome biogenesis GTPase Der [Nitrospirae bacterium]|nr:ribosome biogenesis GTPase Der [Nitrospirota bacterium]